MFNTVYDPEKVFFWGCFQSDFAARWGMNKNYLFVIPRHSPSLASLKALPSQLLAVWGPSLPRRRISEVSAAQQGGFCSTKLGASGEKRAHSRQPPRRGDSPELTLGRELTGAHRSSRCTVLKKKNSDLLNVLWEHCRRWKREIWR